MPFDGTQTKPLKQDETLLGAITLLERGLARVTAGYCTGSFYRPQTWYRRTPKFCMYGSLFFTDTGTCEERSWSDDYSLAYSFLCQAIGEETLIKFGSRLFARRSVIHAYKRALTAAQTKLVRSPVEYQRERIDT